MIPPPERTETPETVTPDQGKARSFTARAGSSAKSWTLITRLVAALPFDVAANARTLVAADRLAGQHGIHG
jgi:hypothetical protein